MAKLAVRGENIDVTPAIKDYVSKKFSKLDKYGQHIVEIVVELHVERNPRISDNKIVDVNIYANGAVLRATDASPDMYASIDMVIDKLDRQMKKYEAIRIIFGSNIYPPAAAHPAIGGGAPTSEPGMIASANTFFKGV